MKLNDDVNNYRPIAIVPILSKLFESGLINFFVPYLMIRYNQVGFAEHGGCDEALFAVKSVISYFLRHDSSAFVYSLDAKMAFDLIIIY